MFLAAIKALQNGFDFLAKFAQSEWDNICREEKDRFYGFYTVKSNDCEWLEFERQTGVNGVNGVNNIENLSKCFQKADQRAFEGWRVRDVSLVISAGSWFILQIIRKPS